MSEFAGPLERRVHPVVAFVVLALALLAVAWPLASRASFSFDDYRYLNAIRKADAGVEGALGEATIVENRWDQQWWIPDDTYVRFWRPFVIASYRLDAAVWGASPGGFVAHNVALHLVCSWLVFLVLARLLARWRPDRPMDGHALLGAALFTVQACHSEQLWYVAGRTDTIAAVAFLVGLVAWLAGRGPVLLAVLFAAMLVAKEYTLLFVPTVLLVERWLPAEPWAGWRALWTRRRSTWVALAVALVAFLAVRHVALGDAGSGSKTYPYFFLPTRAGFAPRTLGVVLDYACSLVTGRSIATFTPGLDEVVLRHGWPRLGLAAAAFVAFCVWSLRTAPGRVGVTSFVLLIAPLLPLYSTGRYLYLPTIGLVLAFAAVIATLRPRWLALGLAAVCIGSQGWKICELHRSLPERPAVASGPEQACALFRDSVFDLAPDAAPILVAEFPMGWLPLQFLRDALEVQLDHDVPPIDALTAAPRGPEPGLLALERRDQGFVMARPNGTLYLPHQRMDFEQRRLAVGDTVDEERYSLVVLRDADGLATAAQITPRTPAWQLGVFRPLPDGRGWHTRPVPDPNQPR